MADRYGAIDKVVADIEQYYEQSFQMWPDACMPVVFALIGHLEDVFPALNAQQTRELNGVLQNVVGVMETKDYVRMRDYLWYDLQTLLQGFRRSSPQ